MTTKRRAATLLAVLMTALWPAIPAGHVQQTGRDFPALAAEVVDIARASFYDSTRAETWVGQHAGYADGADPQHEAAVDLAIQE